MSTKEIKVHKLVIIGLLPQTLIMLAIDCGNNIGYNAIYDSLKYIVLTISSKLKVKNISNIKGPITIGNGDRHCNIEIDYPMTEETFIDISIEAIRGVFKERPRIEVYDVSC